MNVIQLSSFDIAGGAEKIASTLNFGYKDMGHESYLMVGAKKDSSCDAIVIPHDKYRSLYARFFISIANSLAPLGLGATRARITWTGQQDRQRAIGRGEEDFDYPGTRHLLSSLPSLPDIVHCHNLHARYFDLRYLAELSKLVPVVVTLHDEWMMTGHCAYTLGCERWKTGCGECPDLSVYPSIKRDATAFNWTRKKSIYSGSRLFVAAPSQWLLDNVGESILSPAIADSRVIHNGVDLNVFRPGGQSEARDKLGIRKDAKILLFTANGIRDNKFKDFQTLRDTITRVAARLPSVDLQFLALGETANPEQIGNVTITFVPYSSDPEIVAAYYQAADIYLHAANSDNFPTTILESLACGVPVVATGVGGIPEQIQDGVTGYLVTAKDAESMAERVCELLSDDKKREQMKIASAEHAKIHFDKKVMINNYLNWYSEILNDWQSGKQ